MEPAYIIAQIFGICSMISCFLVPMFKKKWQIMTGAIFNNLFIGLNYILLGQTFSGLISLFGIVQCSLVIFHVVREKPVPIAETFIFAAIAMVTTCFGPFAALSGMPFVQVLIAYFIKQYGILPIIAIVSYNISALVRKEQSVRLFLLINAGAWVLYDALILSTAFFGHIIGFVSTAIALFVYREKKKAE